MTTILELRNKAAIKMADRQIKASTAKWDIFHQESERRAAFYESFVELLCKYHDLEAAEIRPALQVSWIEDYHGYSDRQNQVLVTFVLAFPAFEFDNPDPGDTLPEIRIDAWFKDGCQFPAEFVTIFNHGNSGPWCVDSVIKEYGQWHTSLSSAILAAEQSYIAQRRNGCSDD